MLRVIWGAILFFSCSVHAHVGSVSSATGETGRAAVEASESPFGNPASLAYLSGYFFTASFGTSRETAQGTTQDLAVSVTDNMKETVVPTSLSYVQSTTRPPGASDDVLGKTFKLSFGNLVRKSFSFGLGFTHQDDRSPADHYMQTNIQSGVLWAPNSSIGAALVFDNLLKPSDSIPEAFRLKQTIGLGASYNHKRFVRFKADLVSNANSTFHKPILGAGVESYMNRWLIFRTGYQRNNELEANLYTAGMGFAGPKFGLHYAYVTSPENESLNRHSVDLAVPIW